MTTLCKNKQLLKKPEKKSSMDFSRFPLQSLKLLLQQKSQVILLNLLHRHPKVTGSNRFLLAKIGFITARMIVSLDFISAVQYTIHFIHMHHFVR